MLTQEQIDFYHTNGYNEWGSAVRSPADDGHKRVREKTGYFLNFA